MSMQRTILHNVRPTRSDAPIFCGVLLIVAANSELYLFLDTLELVARKIASLVGTPFSNAFAERCHGCSDEHLKRGMGLMLRCREGRLRFTWWTGR